MDNPSNVPAKLLVLISLLQGLILLLLHQSIEFEFWPYQQPQWLFSFYTLAIAAPTMLLLGLNDQHGMNMLKIMLPITLLLGLIGFYMGYQVIPIISINYSQLLMIYIFTMLIACFKGLMYLQQLSSNETISYHSLFSWSWRNFLTLVLAGLFAMSFWGVLMLWGALFKAIEIDFFHTLFTEEWFYYPVLSMAFGFGIIIFRNLSHVIDTITRLQQALMKFLLVVLVLVAILFLVALPFSGLEPLWKSGGSTLILWMMLLMLFFVNAVYQDDPQARPYSIFLHRFIFVGLALLPIYSAISFYGLSLRVDQYGWSIARCWAMLIWSLLTLFSIGYLVGIIRLRDNWLQQLNVVNIVMGIVVLVVMLLVNSPLLDFRKWVVVSQLEQLAQGEINANDLELNYFKNSLAAPGFNALQDLKQQNEESNPSLGVRITSLYANKKVPSSLVSEDEYIAAINVLGGEIPDNLKESLYEKAAHSGWRMTQTKGYYIKSIELNGEAPLEYLFLEKTEYSNSLTLYYWKEEEWNSTGLSKQNKLGVEQDAFIEIFKTEDIQQVSPKWPDLKIGDYAFQINNRY